MDNWTGPFYKALHCKSAEPTNLSALQSEGFIVHT